MRTNLKPNCPSPEKYLVSAMLCFALSACANNDFDDLEQKIAEIKARPKDKIPALPPIKITEPFSFELDGSRDPFVPVETKDPMESNVPDNCIKPDPSRVKEDLESQGLETLRMVGTLKDSTLWGLVRSSSGTVYRVKVGNYMGFNDGEIIEVSNNEIKLMEIVLDKNADKDKPCRIKQPNSLKLVATE